MHLNEITKSSDLVYQAKIFHVTKDTAELEDGKIKGADTLKSSIEKEWADFIVKTDQKGADTKNPPNNVGGETMTRAEIAALPDREARREARLKLLQNEQ